MGASSSGGTDMGKIIGVATAFVIGVASASILAFGASSGQSATGETVGRVTYAIAVTLAPTSHAGSLFAVFVAFVASILTIRSGRTVVALLVGAVVYLCLSFSIAYFTAPI